MGWYVSAMQSVKMPSFRLPVLMRHSLYALTGAGFMHLVFFTKTSIPIFRKNTVSMAHPFGTGPGALVLLHVLNGNKNKKGRLKMQEGRGLNLPFRQDAG
jgi:hypothetical protein